MTGVYEPPNPEICKCKHHKFEHGGRFTKYAKKFGVGQEFIKDITQKNHIIEELEQVRSKDIDKDGKLKLLPKETIKGIIGRSPDYSDAMMMSVYYEIDENYGKYYVQ